MSEDDGNNKEFSKEWDYLKLLLFKYNDLLDSLTTFAQATQGLEHGGLARKTLISKLNTFVFAVTGQFRKYFKEKDYTLEFPGCTITWEDYRISNIVKITEPEKLILMVEIVSFWTQTYGPFATLNEVIDPGEAFSRG